MRPVIASNGAPFLQMRSVGSHSTPGREKEEHKERTGSRRICCCPWSHGLWPKKLSVSVAVPPAPVRVPSQRPLARVSRQSHMSTNDKGDNEMIQGIVHRSPGKPQIGDSDEGCATSHRLQWGAFPPNEVGRVAHYVRKGEGRNERKDGQKTTLYI